MSEFIFWLFLSVSAVLILSLAIHTYLNWLEIKATERYQAIFYAEFQKKAEAREREVFTIYDIEELK